MSTVFRLYLIRHGEAGSASQDSLRELTPRGRVETSDVCRRALEVVPEQPKNVLVSPFTRALQTADIVRSVFRPDPADSLLCRIAPCLMPHQSPEAVAAFLDAEDQISWPLVMVGHQPLLGDILAWLTGGPELGRSVPTSSFSAIDLITFARGCGTLRWQLYP